MFVVAREQDRSFLLENLKKAKTTNKNMKTRNTVLFLSALPQEQNCQRPPAGRHSGQEIIPSHGLSHKSITSRFGRRPAAPILPLPASAALETPATFPLTGARGAVGRLTSLAPPAVAPPPLLPLPLPPPPAALGQANPSRCSLGGSVGGRPPLGLPCGP